MTVVKVRRFKKDIREICRHVRGSHSPRKWPLWRMFWLLDMLAADYPDIAMAFANRRRAPMRWKRMLDALARDFDKAVRAAKKGK